MDEDKQAGLRPFPRMRGAHAHSADFLRIVIYIFNRPASAVVPDDNNLFRDHIKRGRK